MKQLFVGLVMCVLALPVFALQKNVASQKIGVYAYDDTTGDPKTGDAAQITAYVWKDWASGAASNDANPTELDSTNAPGMYVFDMLQAETNADVVCLYAVSSTSNIKIHPVVIHTTPPNFPDAELSTSSALSAASGYASDAKTAAEKIDTSTELRTLMTGADTPVAKDSTPLTAAEVKTEVDAGLSELNLDHLVKIAVDTSLPTTVHDNSVFGYLLAKANVVNYSRTEDSGEGRTDYGDGHWLSAVNVNVASEDNIDFGALKKTSLNAATPDLSAITGDKDSYKAVGFSTHDAAGVKTAIEAAGSHLALILADSGELQTNQGNWATATGFSTHAAADVWVVTMENAKTYAQVMRVMAAVLTGKSTVADDVMTFFGIDGVTDRLAATVASGARTSIDVWDGD